MHPSGEGTVGPVSHRGGHVAGRAGDPPPPADEALPILEPAELEAWQARKRYPAMLSAGGPVFGAACELDGGRWELRTDLTALTVQDAREALARQLRTQGGHDAAADRLEREDVDEVSVRGGRYRVVRAERFIRMGPDGPEPPRTTDADAGPAAGLVLGPPESADAAGPFLAVLEAELRTAMRKEGVLPPRAGEEALRAARTHPHGVLLPATFMAAECEPGGRWRPHSSGTSTSPREARGHLALQLRVLEPWQRDLDEPQRAAYNRAADILEAGRHDELDVDGRHFRVVRIERLLRLGPDGPEPPRPSDPAATATPPPPTESADDLRRVELLLTRTGLTPPPLHGP